MFPVWKRDPSASSGIAWLFGGFARYTLDAEEADPDERRERDLVVVIRSCWIFAENVQHLDSSPVWQGVDSFAGAHGLVLHETLAQ